MTRLEESAIRPILRRMDAHENAAAKDLVGLISQVREEIRAQLLSLDPAAPAAATLAHMDVALQVSLGRLTGQMSSALAGHVRTQVDLGAELADSGLSKALPSADLGLSFVFPPQTLHALQVYHFSLLEDLTTEAKGSISKIIKLGILGGKSTTEVARDLGLTGIRFQTGPLAKTRNGAEAIARTELNRVANMATQERYSQAAAEVPGLQKEWISAHDSRVRPSHARADGQVVGVDEDFTVGGHPAAYPVDPRLPAHESVRCRCRSVPVVPDNS